MPGNLKQTLYPPQINTFLPAFVNTSDAIIYFSLSPYNDSSEIQRVHISLQNQLNNENALTNKTGILVVPLKFDEDSGLYYAVIPTTNVVGGMFNINQFYKVQIRFDSNKTNVPAENADERLWTNYFLQYQTSFSEWSSICLIRPILQPDIQLRMFDTKTGDIAFNKGIIPISGQVFFGDDNVSETETLQSFNIEILPEHEEDVLLKTPEIYTGDNVNPNNINYKLDLQGLKTDYSTKFRFRINITTLNQFKMSKTYDFVIADFFEDESFKPDITVTMDNEDGIVNLRIYNEESVFGTLYVKRSSSLSNFTEWEDIWVDKVAGPVDLKITDNTVGSLVWYTYSVQLENIRGALTQVFRPRDPSKFLPDFYDVILSRGKQQLRIQYNYKVSSFKPVVNRSKVDTLGGRYPKFVENAILNYKQFSISGSISATNDENQKFLDQSDYFGDNFENFLIYNQAEKEHFGYLTDESHNIYLTEEAYARNDYFWEREFREAALAWLNDGEPKLYRSMTEGAMVVMLTDVSLTPNTTLGRRIWDFSATAYEIAEADSLTQLDSLGIYNVHSILKEDFSADSGEVSPDPEFVLVSKVGQIYQYEVKTTNNLISELIAPALQEKYTGVLSDKMPDEFYLKNVKIFFHNDPSVYFIDSDSTMLIPDPGSSSYDNMRDRMQLGYVFGVSTSASEGYTTMFVNERGYYQIPNDLDVDGLYFMNMGRTVVGEDGKTYTIPADIVTIEYTLVYKEKNDMHSIVSGTSVDRTLLGQEQGAFKAGQYVGERIRAKYNYVQPEIKIGDEILEGYVQKMQFWKGLFIEAPAQTMIKLAYKNDLEYRDYQIGESGVFNLIKDFKIQDLCFLGRRMTKVGMERKDFLTDWEYVKITTAYNAVSEIKEPILNCVYNIAGNLKIYYQHQWYDFQEDTSTTPSTGIAAVPTDATINYVGDVIKSTF